MFSHLVECFSSLGDNELTLNACMSLCDGSTRISLAFGFVDIECKIEFSARKNYSLETYHTSKLLYAIDDSTHVLEWVLNKHRMCPWRLTNLSRFRSIQYKIDSKRERERKKTEQNKNSKSNAMNFQHSVTSFFRATDSMIAIYYWTKKHAPIHKRHFSFG